MKEKDQPKLARKASKAALPKTAASKFLLDVKLKTKVSQKATAVRSNLAKRDKNQSDSVKKEVTFDDSPASLLETPRTDGGMEETPRTQDGDSEMLETADDVTDGHQGNENDETGNDENNTNQPYEDTEKGNVDAKNGETDKDKDDKKTGRKGRRKSKVKKDKKEEERKREEQRKAAQEPVGEITAGTEEFRTFIFEKVQSALSIVCTDGVTEINVDNVTPLMKSLDVNTSDEAVLDLIKDSLIDNFGEIVPLDFDGVIQMCQESREETEMDDCLEVAFKLIDFDEDGFITQPDIYQLMLRLGEMLGDYALDDMLEAVDMDKDGKISLRDFRHFLLGRDVPSRKEIFAMAEEVRKKREEEEQRAAKEAEQETANGVEGILNEPDSQDVDDTTNSTNSIQPPEDGVASGLGERSTPLSQSNDAISRPISPDQDNSNNMDNGSDPTTLHQPKTQINSLSENSAIPHTSPQESNVVESEEKINSAETIQDTSIVNNHSTLPSFQQVIEDIDFDHDEIDEDDGRAGSPIPLGVAMGSLDLPPPDLSEVDIRAASPAVTPLCSPRRRPTIVGIGGLAVSPTSDGQQSVAEAIQVLQNDIMRFDNHSPSHSHHRRSRPDISEDKEMLNTISDVEDYNNRLVFKLPPRRKSSTTPPVLPVKTSTTEHDNEDGKNINRQKYVYEKSAVDSDEGIDLAEEELIEKTVCVPCSAQPPSTSLRISLPNEDSPYCQDSPRKTAPKTQIHVDGISDDDDVSGFDRERRASDDKTTLSVGMYSETPRSITRSEMSGMHVSIASARTDAVSSDEDVIEYDTENILENFDEDLFPHSSAGIVNSHSRNSKHPCDTDSILLSVNDEELENHEGVAEKYMLGSNEQLDLLQKNDGDLIHREKTPSVYPPLRINSKTQKLLKNRLSCQKIELKELELNAPISARQFSNRQRFGAIPKDVKKFFVLGKRQISEDSKEEDTLKQVRTVPEKLVPSLRLGNSQRPHTAALTSRERDVLHQRRMCLFQDEMHPLLDQQRTFDRPSNSTDTSSTIQIPSEDQAPPNPLLEQVRSMESRILRRSNTSYEFETVKSCGSVSARSDSRNDNSKRPLMSTSSPRRRHTPRTLKSTDKRISVLDLTKRLRKDSSIKNNVSLAKKHPGYKSMVPLARVVMAYQTAKKRQESQEFYSISRQLEQNGVPYHTNSETKRNLYSAEASTQGERKKKRHKRFSKSPRSRREEEFGPFCTGQDDISTLVESFKDPDVIPADVLYEKVRPCTAPSSSLCHNPPLSRWSNKHEVPHSRLREEEGVTHSSIVTLQLPQERHFERKLKNVSLLSKLPIK